MSEITVGYVGDLDSLQGQVRAELEARPWWSEPHQIPTLILVDVYNRQKKLIELGSLLLVEPRIERADVHAHYSKVVYDVVEGVGALYAKNVLHGNLGLLRVELNNGRAKATVRLV